MQKLPAIAGSFFLHPWGEPRYSKNNHSKNYCGGLHPGDISNDLYLYRNPYKSQQCCEH